MKLKIKSMRARPFTGNDGQEIEYFWYKAEKTDGVTIEFGSRDGGHESSNDFVELDIEKTESPKGFRYKEVPAEQE